MSTTELRERLLEGADRIERSARTWHPSTPGRLRDEQLARDIREAIAALERVEALPKTWHCRECGELLADSPLVRGNICESCAPRDNTIRGTFRSGDGAPCWHNECQCCAGWVEKIKEDRAALSAAEAQLADARRAGFLDGLAAARCHEMHVDLIDAHPNTVALHERLAAMYMRGDAAALTEGERDG